MARIADLLIGAHLPLRLLAGPSPGRPVHAVTSVDSLEAMGRAPVGSLVVVPSGVVGRATPYELDIAVRQAAQRELTAVVLIGCETLPITARQLADRAELPILGVVAALDVAEVVLHIDRVVRGGAADALARAQAALAALRAAEPGGDATLLLSRLHEALGVRVDLTDGTGEGEPVWVDGRRVASLSAPEDEAALVVLPAAAAALARMREAARAREIAPGQSRSDLLTELVVADRTQASRLAERVRDLGLAVDGRHVAIWVAAGPSSAGELATRRRFLDTIVLHVLEHPRTPEGNWNVARIEDALLVLCTTTGGGLDFGQRIRKAARDLLLPHHDRWELRCGIGTARPGLDGLRSSALEARAASATAAARGTLLEEFDATGIQRILAEAAASTLSRKVVDELLRPLDAMGPARSHQAVTTLAAYLDAQRSPRGAAPRLNLHYNAVSYRIRRIMETLEADLDDHETRFALHLACRLRLTAMGG